jgi:hypothetical protein
VPGIGVLEINEGLSLGLLPLSCIAIHTPADQVTILHLPDESSVFSVCSLVSPGIIQYVSWLFSILKFFSLNAPGQLSLSFRIVSNTASITGFHLFYPGLCPVSAFIGVEHWNF